MNRLLIVLSALLGLLFISFAVYYWLTPAGNLVTFIPGYEAGSTTVHFKHGLASLLLGLGLLVFAWFQSGQNSSEQNTPTTTQ